MLRKIFLVSFIIIIGYNSQGQTLFTYGGHAVDAKEFLRAYHKNNTSAVTDKTTSVNSYLNLYISSRLKIHEAYALGYDTLASFQEEVNNLRAQIIENYMNDPVMTEKLNKEAFQRSLKDIRAAHIFISSGNSAGVADSLAAMKKLNEVLQRLQKGEDFLKLAQELSDDPSAKTNKGEIGWLTVFTLPYEFENIIYSTAPGKYSAPYRSRMGFHIFKKLEERKAKGKIKVQQILLAYPPGADANAKASIRKKADSLYKRIMAGDKFERLATAFSNDYISAASGGNLPDIGVGQYDSRFENALWALSKDGAISKPFETSHGWHIVKRISLKPVVTDPNNKPNQQELQQRITADGRWKTAREFIYERVRTNPGLKINAYDKARLWAFSDSLLDRKPIGTTTEFSRKTVLFTIGKTSYTAEDWINYATSFRFQADGSGMKSYEQVMEEFINQSLFNYYRDNLEDFNEEFKLQMQEFKDGNLFFEIMQREIWNRAQNDTLGLQAYYEKNKTNYQWKQSADVIMFFCADLNTANTIHDQMKKKPADWRKYANALQEKMAVDSGRYEWEQIPNLNKMTPKPGMLTNPLLNELDQTVSFAYIVNVYTQPSQRSFQEARGMVISDYQALLEGQWVSELMKKYPVVVDQKVMAEISR